MDPPVHCNTDRTSQLPLESWHDFIADGTLTDAILDRLVHNAYKIKMKGGGGGESMRKWYAKKMIPI
jgi:DNA replication protein DnaC